MREKNPYLVAHPITRPAILRKSADAKKKLQKMWSFAIQRPNTIRQLLSNEDVTLNEVLNDDSLIQALRDEDSRIISYFTNEEHLEELLKWCFSGEYAEDPNYTKNSAKAIEALTTNCGGLQLHLIDDNAFTNFLLNFLDSESIKDTTLCGHFQRIIEHYAKYTRSQIIDKFPDILERLVTKIDKCSLQFLLIQLLTEFNDFFEDFSAFFTKISEVIAGGGDLGYAGIGVIKELFNPDKIGLNQYQEQLTSVFRAALQFATDEKSIPLWSTDAFYLCALMKDKLRFPDFISIMEEFKSKVKFDEPGIVSTAALRLYTDIALQSIDRFFNEQGNTFLSLTVYNSIKVLPKQALKSFIQTSNLPQKIIEAFPTSHCGEITDIAQYLSDMEDIPELNTQAWAEFRDGQLKERLELRKPYGGERPSFSEANDPNSWEDATGQCGITGSAFDFDSSDDDEEDDDQEYGGGTQFESVYTPSLGSSYQSYMINNQDDEYEEEYEEDREYSDDDEDNTYISPFGNSPYYSHQYPQPDEEDEEETEVEPQETEEEDLPYEEEEEQEENKGPGPDPLVEDDIDTDLEVRPPIVE